MQHSAQREGLGSYNIHECNIMNCFYPNCVHCQDNGRKFWPRVFSSAMATSLKVRTFIPVALVLIKTGLPFLMTGHRAPQCTVQHCSRKPRSNLFSTIWKWKTMANERLSSSDRGHFLTQLDFSIFNDCDLLMATTWLRRCRRHKTQSPTIKMTHKKPAKWKHKRASTKP